MNGDDPTVRLGPPSSESAATAPSPPATGAVRPSARDDLGGLVMVDPAYYALGEEIARGGMGRIQLARDRRLGREVALKELIETSSALDTRFEREARITARLQHPSIVSVHEAGRWPSGQPFYAMELVSGRSLHAAIADTKTLAERLALVPNLVAVADAMAYAHSKRVIHRDLKPGNVIVGEFGETVVIDWGIAKYVDATDPPVLDAPAAADGETQAGVVMGTPGYMSPEQAAGEVLDERTDVYAIGAIAFHMLTGRAPTGQPVRLLAREPAVPQDLAAIVDRAMAVDRDARYRSARELADDLRRFQTGQLVGAHRYSLGQLVRRWLRRHRGPVAVAAVAVLVLLAVGGYALHGVISARAVADEQRALATQRGADAEDAMGFMLFDLGDKLRRAGRLELMDAVMRRASSYYDARAAAGDTDPVRVVSALESVGLVLHDEGDIDHARAQYDRVLAIANVHLLDASPEPAWLHHASLAHSAVGELLYQKGSLSSALGEERAAISLAEKLVAREPGEARAQDDLATAQSRAATFLEDSGVSDEALALVRSALAIRTALAADHPDFPRVRHSLVTAHSDLASALEHRGDAAGATRELHLALELAGKLAEDEPQVPEWRRDLAVAHEHLGDTLRAAGDTTAALAEFREVIAIMDVLARSEPANTDWQRRLSIGHERLGTTLLQTGDIDIALVALRASKQIRLALTTRDPTNARWQRDLSVVTNRIGDALLARGDAAGALDAFRTAKEIRDRLAAKDSTNAKWQADLFESRRRIGSALERSDAKAALEEYTAALEIARTVTEKDPGALPKAEISEVREAAARLRAAAAGGGSPSSPTK